MVAGINTPMESGEDAIFPMRINKYLAFKKHATRRGADELIKKKQVFLNGKPAVLGDKVKETDVVEVKFRGKPTPNIYFAYHKPEGLTIQELMANSEPDTARSESLGRDFSHGKYAQKKPAGRGGKPFGPAPKKPSALPLPAGVFPVGGLDKDARGLVILTNDGRLTDILLSPSHDHEREYVVATHGPLRSSFKEKMEGGVKIEDGVTKKCKVRIIDSNVFKIVLREERRHQIRRMCAALFQEVKDLQRVRIMNVSVKPLKEGDWRKLEGEELKDFLVACALS